MKKDDEWVDVNDELPERGKWVLVSYSYSKDDPDTFVWIGQLLETGTERRKFWSSPAGDSYINVRAWMSMPRPYRLVLAFVAVVAIAAVYALYMGVLT